MGSGWKGRGGSDEMENGKVWALTKFPTKVSQSANWPRASEKKKIECDCFRCLQSSRQTNRAHRQRGQRDIKGFCDVTLNADAVEVFSIFFFAL